MQDRRHGRQVGVKSNIATLSLLMKSGNYHHGEKKVQWLPIYFHNSRWEKDPFAYAMKLETQWHQCRAAIL